MAQPSSPSTNAQDISRIAHLCQQQVHDWAVRQGFQPNRAGDTLPVRQVTAIVVRNLASGRAAHIMPVLRSRPLDDAAIQSYAERVLHHYLREHLRVERLVARDDEEWQLLHGQLTRRAYFFLRRLATRADHTAEDFAHDACVIILYRHFPYDVPFNAWAHCILFNCIRDLLRRQGGWADRRQHICSLDGPNSTHLDDNRSAYNFVPDHSTDLALQQVEMREWLVRSMAQLRSYDQLRVIVYTYLHDLTTEQIAMLLRLTPQGVYSLRGRALRRLRGIMDTGNVVGW